MKKLALFISLAAILMVGCKKDNPVVPEIICDTDVVNVPVAGTEDEDIFVLSDEAPSTTNESDETTE